MALRGASATTSEQGDWLDWQPLAEEGAAVVCTLLDREPAKNFGNGEVEPVVAHVIVLTGSRAGEVHERERILKAGIRMKFDGCDIGDSVVGRLGVYGQRKNVGLNNEADGDVELAERALAKLGPKSSIPAQNNGGTAKKAASKAAASADDDTEPPF